MNFIRRWTTSIASSFDYVISQVENHDALVSAAIREMQVAGSRARGQLARVRKDGERMRQRQRELVDVVALWKERAVRTDIEAGGNGEDTALECLRRKKSAEREREILEQHLVEHEKAEQSLTKDLKVIEDRITELKRKKNTMNARQYRAEALKAGQLSELGLIGEIDEIFDRWEARIGEYDIASESVDPLEIRLSTEEELQSLRAELQNLRAHP